MKTWEQARTEIKSLSEEEKNESRQLAHIIANLIKRRQRLGLTQQEVADRAGLKQEAIARLEAAKKMPRFDTLLRVSNSLNMEISISPRSSKKANERAAEKAVG